MRMNNSIDLRHKAAAAITLHHDLIRDWTERVTSGLVKPEHARSHIEWAQGRIETAEKFLRYFVVYEA
jgi:hypothetical protein